MGGLGIALAVFGIYTAYSNEQKREAAMNAIPAFEDSVGLWHDVSRISARSFRRAQNQSDTITSLTLIQPCKLS